MSHQVFCVIFRQKFHKKIWEVSCFHRKFCFCNPTVRYAWRVYILQNDVVASYNIGPMCSISLIRHSAQPRSALGPYYAVFTGRHSAVRHSGTNPLTTLWMLVSSLTLPGFHKWSRCSKPSWVAFLAAVSEVQKSNLYLLWLQVWLPSFHAKLWLGFKS